MVLKANDRRTSCPCHNEFRGPRSDYVRQVASENNNRYPFFYLIFFLRVQKCQERNIESGILIGILSASRYGLNCKMSDQPTEGNLYFLNGRLKVTRFAPQCHRLSRGHASFDGGEEKKKE
ncbi:hypothetical protein TNCV_489951 [Trichonephila clavipes]|nr:hypothetical protein TNCV_489951 [Trichonephila clavipes]